jgi:hypothetical protein
VSDKNACYFNLMKSTNTTKYASPPTILGDSILDNANPKPRLFYLLAKEFEYPYRIRKRDLTGHGPPLIRAEKMQTKDEDW